VDADEVLGQCRVSYFLSRGPGGQRRDRKMTAVRLLHLPTGIVVIATRRRSRAQNMQEALERLLGKLEERAKVKKPRIRTRMPAAVKETILRGKKRRSVKKVLRKRVRGEEE
jgi:peptide chain release factor 2